MNVVWKRPDGFHGATPADFVVVELGGHSRLWLHKKDHDQFPFRVSGGWEEDVATRRLNNLVNLLKEGPTAWRDFLVHTFNHSIQDNPDPFFAELVKWLQDLQQHLKGDKWEIEIMGQALSTVEQKLLEQQKAFSKAVSS